MRFPYSGNGTWTPDYHCGFIDAVKRFFIGTGVFFLILVV